MINKGLSSLVAAHQYLDTQQSCQVSQRQCFHNSWKMISPRVLFLCLLVSASCQATKYEYDCRRMEDCLNGGICITESSDPDALGTCICDGVWTGYNCEIDTNTPCDKVCSNGGTCYGAPETCGCPFGYIGETCDKEMVEIACGGSSVRFDITFPDAFDGIVKLDTDQLTGQIPTECAFTEIVDAGLKNYSLDISVENSSDGTSCGQEQLTENTKGQITFYTALFRVQYLRTLMTFVDQLYNLTCVHNGEDTMVYKEITNVNVNTVGNLSVVTKNTTYITIGFDILDTDGLPMAPGKELYIGDMFMLHVFLTDNLVYTDMQIVQCTANNTLTGSEEKTYMFFDRGCPTKAGKRSATEQIPEPKDINGQMLNGKKITVWTFMFIDSPLVGFVCSVKVCKDGDNTCNAPTDCDAVRKTPEPTTPPPTTPPPTTLAPTDAPPVNERKKRESGNEEEVENTFSTVIHVRGPRDYSVKSQSGTSTEPDVIDCLSQTEIMAVIWVLGAVVFVLFIAVIVLACIIINRRNGPKNAFEPPKPYAVRADRFQLPRAHVNQAYMEA